VIACLGYNGRGVALATALGGEIAKFARGADPAGIALPVTRARAAWSAP
jgi:hypothetical protein